MRHYFFLSSALPHLEFESKPLISFTDLTTLFSDNMTEGDLREVNRLRLYFDLQNLLAYLEEEEIDFRGVLSLNDLKEALSTGTYFPDYLFEYFEEWGEKRDQVEHFGDVIKAYFENESVKKGAASQFIVFDLERKRFLEKWRKGEKGSDQFEALEETLAKADGNPYAIEKAVSRYRFETFDEIARPHPFSLVTLLAYMLQLMIVEDFDMRSNVLGREIVNTLVKESA